MPETTHQSSTSSMAAVAALRASALPSLLILAAFWAPSLASPHRSPRPYTRPSPKHEKFTELSFFLHDDVDAANASAFFVLQPITGFPKDFTARALFGAVVVMDDPLTKGPDPASTLIGRAKGFYVWDSINGQPALEFVFTAVLNHKSGFQEGTTVSYRGFDYIPDVVRELSIVGGTKDFRLARGWAQFSVVETVGFNAVLNFTSFIFHGAYE